MIWFGALFDFNDEFNNLCNTPEETRVNLNYGLFLCFFPEPVVLLFQNLFIVSMCGHVYFLASPIWTVPFTSGTQALTFILLPLT